MKSVFRVLMFAFLTFALTGFGVTSDQTTDSDTVSFNIDVDVGIEIVQVTVDKIFVQRNQSMLSDFKLPEDQISNGELFTMLDYNLSSSLQEKHKDIYRKPRDGIRQSLGKI